MRKSGWFCGVFAALVLACSMAQGAWPERAVTLVVPFPPGGITDTLARITAERLQTALKQPFVVENRPGGAGVIATERVAQSTPDGYTLLVGTVSQISISPFTHTIKFDPIRDFKPISIIAVSPFVIIVPKDLPVSTLKEFVEYAKGKPDQLNFGSAGVGALSHFASEMFVRRAELKMTHVPYRGGALALSDLLGGNIQMLSASPIEIQQYIGTGQIKLLGISSAERSAKMQDVPAIAELYPGHSALTWNGLLAPAGTPQEIIDRLSVEMQAAQQEPEFRERLEKLGVTPVRHTPADFAKVIADDMAHWRVVVEQIGLKAQ